MRSGALRAGASIGYKKYGKTSWKESSPTSALDGPGDLVDGQTETTGNTDVSLKRNEYSATLGASYDLFQDRIEPYVLVAYIGGKAKWDYNNTATFDQQWFVSTSNHTLADEETTTDRTHIKGTFIAKNPVTGTLGMYLPMGAKSGEGRGGGLDVSVSFLGQTSVHLGGDIRF